MGTWYIYYTWRFQNKLRDIILRQSSDANHESLAGPKTLEFVLDGVKEIICAKILVFFDAETNTQRKQFKVFLSDWLYNTSEEFINKTFNLEDDRETHGATIWKQTSMKLATPRDSCRDWLRNGVPGGVMLAAYAQKERRKLWLIDWLIDWWY